MCDDVPWCVGKSRDQRSKSGVLLVASRGYFSGIAVVYQAAEYKRNGCTVESGPGLPWFTVRLRRCTVGQIMRELAKLKFTDFHVVTLHYTT